MFIIVGSILGVLLGLLATICIIGITVLVFKKFQVWSKEIK